MQALDLYVNVSQQVTLSVNGPGDLHLSGFFEPQSEEMGDNLLYGDEDEEDEDEEEEVGAKVNSNLKQAKQNALKNATVAKRQQDSDEDDDEDFDDDEGLDEDEDEEESEDVPVSKKDKNGS